MKKITNGVILVMLCLLMSASTCKPAPMGVGFYGVDLINNTSIRVASCSTAVYDENQQFSFWQKYPVTEKTQSVASFHGGHQPTKVRFVLENNQQLTVVDTTLFLDRISDKPYNVQLNLILQPDSTFKIEQFEIIP